ncbi:MAG: site-specific integrase [Lachnospiraceae bacterium]|nr:site-specific integrase [Lachnospiraceae bacterium]
MRGKDGKIYRKRTLKRGEIYEVLVEGKWKSTGQQSLDRAMTWAKKYIAEGNFKQILLKDFAENFFCEESDAMKKQAMRGRVRSKGWYAQSQARLQRYILPYFGDFYLHEITPQVIDLWLLDLKSPDGKELSSATKNKAMNCLKQILQEAQAKGHIDTHPMVSLQAFVEKNKERKIFDDDELDRFFPMNEARLVSIWGGLLWTCYFLVLRDTGLRMGEQAVLTWDDLFFENGQHGFFVTKSQDWFTKAVKMSTKTGYHRATLITPRTYRLLMLLKKEHPWDLIFALDGKRGIIAETARKHLKFAAKNAGVDLAGRTPYCFRHTANTNLLLRADPQQVRFLMGHRTEKETINYNHPDRRLLAKKAAAIKLGKI